MKIAIVHDDLMRKGGAEKVALAIVRAFPEADFYTLCYRPELTYDEFNSYKVNTSWFQQVAKTESQMKMLFYPLGIWAMKSLKLEQYDLVIISTTFCAKYIKLNPRAVLVTYCHTPFRLAWYPETYNNVNGNMLFRWLTLNVICPRLRVIEKKYAIRTNHYIANSNVTVDRIKTCYTDKIPVSIINPPVELKNFRRKPQRVSDYYLVVSRFQPYKKIDLVIEAFNAMPEKKLIIVGTGGMEMELKAMAGKNVEFRGVVGQDELGELYAGCKALIFPQEEDFGITPLEANASGRPVIALGKGGVLETMVPYDPERDMPFTAIFFAEQTLESLLQAVQLFETVEGKLNENFIYQNAERFSESGFIDKLKKKVAAIYSGD